jgi:hypothetical protein
MFGLTIISTKTLRNLRQKIKDQETTIVGHEKTIKTQKAEIADLTPNRDAGGRFASAPSKAKTVTELKGGIEMMEVGGVPV